MNFLEFSYRTISPKKILSSSNLQKCFKLLNASNEEEFMNKSTLINFLEPHFYQMKDWISSLSYDNQKILEKK